MNCPPNLWIGCVGIFLVILPHQMIWVDKIFVSLSDFVRSLVTRAEFIWAKIGIIIILWKFAWFFRNHSMLIWRSRNISNLLWIICLIFLLSMLKTRLCCLISLRKPWCSFKIEIFCNVMSLLSLINLMHACSMSANFFLLKNLTGPKRLYGSVGLYYVEMCKYIVSFI